MLWELQVLQTSSFKTDSTKRQAVLSEDEALVLSQKTVPVVLLPNTTAGASVVGVWAVGPLDVGPHVLGEAMVGKPELWEHQWLGW